MGKLHEVLAVEGELGKTARHELDRVGRLFAMDDVFSGSVADVKPFEEAMENGLPVMFPERQVRLPRETVPGLLEMAREHVGRHWNAVADKETTNTNAFADVIVDGETLLHQVPATYLLPMEKHLAQLRMLVHNAPISDASIPWSDSDLGDHVRQSPEEHVVLTKKKPDIHKIHAPTEYQAGTHEIFSRDLPAGEKRTVKLDARMEGATKRRLLHRIDTLYNAIREARARANQVEVQPTQHGTALLDWIFS